MTDAGCAVQAVQSARAAAEQHTPSDMQIDAAPRDLPAFGSGIEFRPKAKSGGPEEDGRAAKASGRPERVTWAHKEEHGPRVRGPAHLDYMDAAALELVSLALASAFFALTRTHEMRACAHQRAQGVVFGCSVSWVPPLP